MKTFKQYIGESANHKAAHAKIVSGLKQFDSKNLESDGHALFGDLTCPSGGVVYVNIIDPANTGSYVVEINYNDKEIFRNEDLSPEDVIDGVSKVIRNLPDFL
jgi:hypothetical protein